MRGILIVLLVANIALFVWYWFESNRLERIAALNEKYGVMEEMPGEPLALLKEIPDSERQARGIVPLGQKPKVNHSSVSEIEEKVQAMVTEATGQSEPDQMEESAASTTEEVVEKEVGEEGPEPIETIREAVPGQGLCLMVGPVVEEIQGEQVQQRLAALNIKTNISNLEIPGEADYWVILPPADSREEALQMLMQLQGNNIDSYLIPEGDMANAVSLGMFGQEENAIAQRDAYHELGYQVEVRTKARIYYETWLTMDEVESAKLDNEVWLKIQVDFPEMEKRPSFCSE